MKIVDDCESTVAIGILSERYVGKLDPVIVLRVNIVKTFNKSVFIAMQKSGGKNVENDYSL